MSFSYIIYHSRFVAFKPVILLLKTWVNRTYSSRKIKLVFYIKTINYYNSDYKIEIYTKNYGFKVHSNNHSMCHCQKIKSLQAILVVLQLSIYCRLNSFFVVHIHLLSVQHKFICSTKL